MSNHEWDKINDKERKIVQKYLGELRVRLGAMAKELGVKVKLSSLPANCSGLIRRVDGEYEIKINRHESKNRQRFTLAHEISHFLLHKSIIEASIDGIKDDVLYRSGESKDIEYEANRLAAQLVMPDTLIQEKVGQYGASISEDFIEYLSQEFGVSRAAMEIKLSTMDIHKVG